MSDYEVAEKHLGFAGVMLSGSKLGYWQSHPKNEVYFNANLVKETGEKIWFGDLDLTLQSEQLKALAKELKITLYVLKEMDYRFDTEGRVDFRQVAVWVSN